MINLQSILKDADRIAISGHIRPDGDCVGSTTGLYSYIKTWYPEKHVDLYLEDIPQTFSFIKASDCIKYEIDDDEVYDVFFILDCGDAGRLGFSEKIISVAKKTVCVDHHISNQAFANENYIVPEASSTSELIFNLLEKEKITKEIAESLYTGIVHDTGVFQYSCTAPSTMMTAAELMKTGIDFTNIIEDTFYKKTYAQNQILGKALLESHLLLDGRFVYSVVTKELMDYYSVTAKELDGIVNQLRITEGVEVAGFIYELSEKEHKISLRAKGDTDVSKVAVMYGGGGHKKAAGFSVKGDLNSFIDDVTEKLRIAMKESGAL